MKIINRLVRTNREILEELQRKGIDIYKKRDCWEYVLAYLAVALFFLIPITVILALIINGRVGH